MFNGISWDLLSFNIFKDTSFLSCFDNKPIYRYAPSYGVSKAIEATQGTYLFNGGITNKYGVAQLIDCANCRGRVLYSTIPIDGVRGDLAPDVIFPKILGGLSVPDSILDLINSSVLHYVCYY